MKSRALRPGTLQFFVAICFALLLKASAQTEIDSSQFPILSDLKSLWEPFVDLSSWDEGNTTCENWKHVVCDEGGFVMELHFNQTGLEGPIPRLLSRFDRLALLDLSGNNIDGGVETWMPSLLAAISVLILQGNSLTGPIPRNIDLWSGTLLILDLSDNLMNGTLPSKLGTLTNLVELDLSGNYFTGSITPSLFQLSQLRYLELSDNELVGSIPDLFNQLPELQDLGLWANGFTGHLPPSIGALSKLVALQITDCFLTGPIPPTYGALSQLQYLSLYNNSLTGSIPASLGNLNSLLVMDLSLNQLTGFVPSELSQLQSIVFLCFSDNLLTGIVPSNWVSPEIGDSANGTYNIARNYFYGDPTVEANGEQFCPQGQLGQFATSNLADTQLSNFGTQAKNCLTFPDGFPCPAESQKRDLECIGFCGATLPSSPCGGHGTCSLTGDSLLPTCACNPGFFLGLGNYTDAQGNVLVQYPTCLSKRSIIPVPVPPSGNFTSGLVPSTVTSTSNAFSPFFRHLSVGFQGFDGNGRPQWSTAQSVDWRSAVGAGNQAYNYVNIIRDQSTCSACWAFSTASVIESALAIASPVTPPVVPSISVQEFLNCDPTGSCAGGWPLSSLAFAANVTRSKAGGLQSAATVPYVSSKNTCSIPKGPYGIRMFEQVNYGGFQGLLLAVQRQPVIGGLEADQQSFLTFPGGFVYNDPNCFANQLITHNVVIVGYNLNAAIPYWIIRNSWGKTWGEQGYMRLALVGGAGICGINTFPALYPVVKVTDPCAAPNPCGGGQCSPVTSARVRCACLPGFRRVKTVDYSETCAPVKTCTFLSNNPCQVGNCVDNALGGYTCICPRGFVSGQLPDGTTTCIPGNTPTTYLVPVAKSITCYQVYTAFGLTKVQFLIQNLLVNCGGFLPANLLLHVNNPGLASCSLPYSITKSDTCSSIFNLFSITASAFAALNPGVDCNNLLPGMTLCMERSFSDKSDRALILCSKYYTVDQGDTCEYIYKLAARPPLPARDFFRLNPGINCDNLVPNSGQQTPGQQVCLSGSPYASRRCPYRTYFVRRGDSCFSLLFRFFRGYRDPRKGNKFTPPSALFVHFHGVGCSRNLLFNGAQICLPPPKK